MTPKERDNTTPSEISAIVTAYERVDQTLTTLSQLKACSPPPAEILVHVDRGERTCAEAIRRAFPEVKLLVSDTCFGPGGGRNKLIAAAKNELVASFDDDSYPLDTDYFARVLAISRKRPDAAIIGGAVYHRDEEIRPDSRAACWVSDFSGGACTYRRSMFLTTAGYVPLAVAYGMEEVDLSIRLHAQGARILRSPWLRLFHDTDLKRHDNPAVTAGSIANMALLTYLRYPPSVWHLGLGQCLNRIVWLLRNGRHRGILSGLGMIPGHLRKNRSFRQTIARNSLKSYLKLRHSPVPAEI